jgi:RNA polymerase sigma-70 factor (ECF subfamily)
VVSGLVSRRLVVGGSSEEPVIPIARLHTAERELVVALIQGQPAAIAELFDRFRSVVRKMLIRTLGSAHDVDDLAQETFLVVLRRVETLRDPALLSSFVIGAAVRVAKNELRKRALRRWIGLDEVPLAVDTVDPELRDSVERLYRALSKLDAAARMIFVLRYVEELELTELADAMSLSVSTVKRRLALAERRFDAIARNDPVLRSYLEGKR